VAAGLLGTTRAIEVYLFGDFTNNTGSNQTLRLSGTFGGSQFYDMGAVSFGTNASARFWELRVVLQAHGATNSQFSAMVARVAPPGSVNAAGNVAGDFSNSDGYDNLAIDSTAAQTMSLDATLGAASASLTVNLKGGFLKLV
jgi:hypothetical protein